MNAKTVAAVFSVLTGTAILILTVALSRLLPKDEGITVIVIGLIAFLAGAIAAIDFDYNNGEYTCSKCGHTFTPTLKSYIMSMNMGSKRRLTCPNCNEKSWCKRK